ncbi:hypothetical protein [Thermincola ferriacetica]
MTDRQRQLKISLLLAVGITIVCGFITWLIFNKSEQTFSSPSGFGQRLPEVAYKFTIGGDGSTGPYKLSEPMAVDVADNGDIYVADTLNNQIKIFDKEGKFKKVSGAGNCFTYLPIWLLARKVFSWRIAKIPGYNFFLWKVILERPLSARK